MLVNHYYRCKPPKNTLLSGEMESIVVQLCPQDFLVGRVALVDKVRDYLIAHPGEAESLQRRPEGVLRNSIEGVLQSLVERGFIKELEGIALERFADSLPHNHHSRKS